MFGEIVHNAGMARKGVTTHTAFQEERIREMGKGSFLLIFFIIQASMMMVQLVHNARAEEGRPGEA